MEKSSFFNSVSGDRVYRAEEWAEYFASFIGNGVFPVPSTSLQVVAGSGMAVAVKTGKAWINGYFYYNTSDLPVTLATADGVLNRIDRIVVRWDLTERKISVAVKSSAPATSPVAPALQRDADAYELCLADVLVGAGVTAISQANITDRRLDGSLCGVVAGVVDQIDTDAFNAQLEAWFADYKEMSVDEFNDLVSYMESLELLGDQQYAALEAYMNDFKADAENDFNAWFATLQNVLDEDTAGHISLREVLRMSEQRKTTGTRKRAPKKDTESKTTRTRKKVAEEQAAPVQQNEEAAPDRVKAEEEQTARAPEQMAGKSEHDGAKPEQTPPAAGSFEVGRVLKVAKPLMRGDDVKALQTALIERNYHCGTNGADGTYGRLTAYAVRCFQASKGLIVNGRADRYTIAALGGTWKE